MRRIISILLAMMICPILAIGGEIIDMAGRKVVIPDRIERVIPYDNKTNMLLYPIASEMMIAKAWAGENSSMRFISEDYMRKEEVDLKNAEEVLKLNPDVIIVGTFINKNTVNERNRYIRFAEKIKKPLIVVDLEIMNLDKTYEFLGQLLACEEASKHCSDFIREIYTDIINENDTREMPTVYIAHTESGLRTAPKGSIHAQLFDILGVNNVISAPMDTKGFALINIEQLMAANPEYIFCMGKGNSNPFESIKNKKVWNNLSAIKEGKLYKVPSDPFIWFDMPPSINRLCGLIWFCEVFKGQKESETRDKIKQFYRIFYKYDLKDTEYTQLMNL